MLYQDNCRGNCYTRELACWKCISPEGQYKNIIHFQLKKNQWETENKQAAHGAAVSVSRRWGGGKEEERTWKCPVPCTAANFFSFLPIWLFQQGCKTPLKKLRKKRKAHQKIHTGWKIQPRKTELKAEKYSHTNKPLRVAKPPPPSQDVSNSLKSAFREYGTGADS